MATETAAALAVEVVIEDVLTVTVVLAAPVEALAYTFLFLLGGRPAGVQGAVTGSPMAAPEVTVVVVAGTSVIGTKDEQNAEALSAMRTALQSSTEPRASRLRGTCRANVEAENNVTRLAMISNERILAI